MEAGCKAVNVATGQSGRGKSPISRVAPFLENMGLLPASEYSLHHSCKAEHVCKEQRLIVP